MSDPEAAKALNALANSDAAKGIAHLLPAILWHHPNLLIFWGKLYQILPVVFGIFYQLALAHWNLDSNSMTKQGKRRFVVLKQM
jgi:hypothetical protein